MLVLIWLEPDNITRPIIWPACIGTDRVVIDDWQKGNRSACVEPDRIYIIAIKRFLRLFSSYSLHLSHNRHLTIGLIIEHVRTGWLTQLTGFQQVFASTVNGINRPCHEDKNQGNLDLSV